MSDTLHFVLKVGITWLGVSNIWVIRWKVFLDAARILKHTSKVKDPHNQYSLVFCHSIINLCL